eukprot:gene24611-10230_t
MLTLSIVPPGSSQSSGPGSPEAVTIRVIEVTHAEHIIADTGLRRFAILMRQFHSEPGAMSSSFIYHLPQVIGVVGAGTMGSGIAQTLVQKGFKVILFDTKHNTDHEPYRGIALMTRNLDKLAKQGVMTPIEVQSALARLEPAVSLDHCKRVDFVIEAAPEDEEVKKMIFRKLDQVTSVQTILASNTSSISITRLAAVTSKPHRVVGMHFMHPVPDQPLVELAKGMHTSIQTFENAKSLCHHLGKTVCVSEDRPGFILYRILMPMINEAFFCMMEGVGSPDDIDRGMRLGTEMQLGPLKLADSI